MSYQALYRVWRPQTFADVSGQTVITQTLKNAILQGNTSHAYLFTGPRGTGKTSAAKIFAKAINCPYSENGEPCNECPICQEITNGSLGDVIEIDAASNNGVEEIRDIREKANYAPTRALYKVYIIDEVHMLSAGAFNALLKTLEEPPSNVIFILATTEPHKIPATIISRTQRFDFKRIDTQAIIDRLVYILNEREVSYDDDAVLVIANAAEGGMRDALSMLDQALSFMQDHLTEDVALQITGSITQSLLIGYIEAISLQETEKALNLLHDILAEGKDEARFVEDTIMLTRDLLLYQTNSDQEFVTKLAKVDEPFKALASSLEREQAYRIIDVFNTTSQEIRMSNHGEVYLEVATVKLTQAQILHQQPASQPAETTQVDDKEIQSLKRQLSNLESQVGKLSSGQVSPTRQKRSTQTARSINQEFKVNTKAIYAVLEGASREYLNQLREIWGDLIHALDAPQAALLKNSEPKAASPVGMVVSFEYDILCAKYQNDQALQEKIANYIEKYLDFRPELVCVPENKWDGIRQYYIDNFYNKEDGNRPVQKSTNTDNQEEESGAVKAAIDMFGEENITIED